MLIYLLNIVFLHNLIIASWSKDVFGHLQLLLDVGQEILTLSGAPDFTPFGEFMISPIHYIYITEFVSFRTILTD